MQHMRMTALIFSHKSYSWQPRIVYSNETVLQQQPLSSPQGPHGKTPLTLQLSWILP